MATVDHEGATRPRALVFGEIAEQYERARWSYPAELVQDVLDLVPRRPTAVEIGAGTGKATRLFAPSMARLLAVEPSREMASVARRVLAPWPAVEVIVSTFEVFTPDVASVDLVLSAQAWHWVDPVAGIPKVRELLGDDGVLAVFWNRPRPESHPLVDEVRAVFARVAPPLVETAIAVTGTVGIDAHRARLVDAGCFRSVEHRQYQWDLTFTTTAYVDLLGTHSEIRVLPDADRAALLGGVSDLVDGNGGTVTVGHTTELLVAIG